MSPRTGLNRVRQKTCTSEGLNARMLGRPANHLSTSPPRRHPRDSSLSVVAFCARAMLRTV